MPVLKEIKSGKVRLFVLPDATEFSKWEEAGIEGYYTVPTSFPEEIKLKPDIVVFIDPFKHCVHQGEYAAAYERITAFEKVFGEIIIF